MQDNAQQGSILYMTMNKQVSDEITCQITWRSCDKAEEVGKGPLLHVPPFNVVMPSSLMK